ncbi:hypothetical protein H4Q26_015832 [Puccinia striiformis f. sp. tritici PST-130]|nr:hypothetical protein H4Q26_015832 [Puccinia striiformis f. sp. tritici PST-130]
MLDNVEHLEDYEEAIRRAIDRLYEKLNENLAGETNVLDDDLTERAVYSTDPAKTNELKDCGLPFSDLNDITPRRLVLKLALVLTLTTGLNKHLGLLNGIRLQMTEIDTRYLMARPISNSNSHTIVISILPIVDEDEYMQGITCAHYQYPLKVNFCNLT